MSLFVSKRKYDRVSFLYDITENKLKDAVRRNSSLEKEKINLLEELGKLRFLEKNIKMLGKKCKCCNKYHFPSDSKRTKHGYICYKCYKKEKKLNGK